MASQHEQVRKQNGKAGPKPLVWQKNLRSAVECYYSDIDPATLRRAIDAVTRGGGAIMLGITSDGGAYSVCVLHDDQKLKDYPHGKEECEEALLALEAMFVGN